MITVTSELDDTATFNDRAIGRHVAETLHIMIVREVSESEAADRALGNMVAMTDYRTAGIELPNDPRDYELSNNV